MPTSATRGATAALAEWAASARCADLPEPVRHEAVRALLNYLGCAIGGANHPARTVFETALGGFSGPGRATVIGTARRADTLHAALANALGATVDAFCDTHAEAIIHPSAPVIAAALALAEQQRARGEVFLLAIVLGLETACRLSKAISVTPARGSLGWLQTAVAGGLGAAVAAGSLLGLDAQRIARAIGIAATQAGGLRISMGTMSTPLAHAQGAETGLRAALLAAAGFTGPQDVIEGEHGYAQMFSTAPALDHLTSGLGERFELLALTYKAYPCGIVAHPIIDAALKLKATGIDAPDVERIEARVHPSAVALTGRQHPKNGNEAQFSLHHWAAVALVHGTARVSDASPDRLVEPSVVALRARIQAVADPAMAPDAAALSATLCNGERIAVNVEHCTGSAARPMSDADIATKFRGLADGHLDSARIAAAIGLCRRVQQLDDVSRLAAACSRDNGVCPTASRNP